VVPAEFSLIFFSFLLLLLLLFLSLLLDLPEELYPRSPKNNRHTTSKRKECDVTHLCLFAAERERERERERKVYFLTAWLFAKITKRPYYMTEICVWSVGLMILTVENRDTRRKILSQRHFSHHKSQMDWSGTELRLSHFETSNETTVIHDLQHANRAGPEMVAKPAMLALQLQDTTNDISRDCWSASGSSIMVCPFSLCFCDSNKSANFFEKK